MARSFSSFQYVPSCSFPSTLQRCRRVADVGLSSVHRLTPFQTVPYRDVSGAKPSFFVPSPAPLPSLFASSRCPSSLASQQQLSWRSFSSDRPVRPISKLLIANRGEIAVRIHRACKELGIKTVSIYSAEDSQALHRIVADESYQVGGGGEGGTRLGPVQCYLSSEEIVRVAKQTRCDAVHPGYGFLSENADFAEEVEMAGLMFVGPRGSVVRRMGDKVEARKTAIEAGLSVVPGVNEPVTDFVEAEKICNSIGYPVMLKAAYGGGGRGMRKVFSESEVKEAFERATSEALSAFGNGEMFIEKLVIGGQHIEVQVIGDHHGNVYHLLERDCSVQRRHQKVVEIAPAPFLDETVRQKLLKAAVAIARHTRYENAGTIEFLIDPDLNHYFIEVNARLQVEHTVTEEVTGIDIVKTQIQVREGKSLPDDLGFDQTEIEKKVAICDKTGIRGPVALQCRITTEDSQLNFQPNTGRIDLYQPSTGPGIRLDGAVGASGAIITPFYDSLLVKIIAKGKDFDEAVKRAYRALRETRIRGVVTNIPFILNVLEHPVFLAGKTTVTFIDDHPELCVYDPLDISSQSICRFLAEIVVNGPRTLLVNKDAAPSQGVAHPPPLPACATVQMEGLVEGGGSWTGPPEDFGLKALTAVSKNAPRGYKQLLDEVGPEGFVKVVRSESRVLLTDTTFRDAHQSLFATRMRTFDMMNVAPSYAYHLPQLFSLENWGGATFDVSYRFLRESPWRRLELLREAIPNIPFQMLLRGANAVGYTAYPDNVVFKFCEEAVKYGMDIFRVFDSLNYLDNLKLGIQAVGAAGGVVEAAIAYTGNVSNTERGPYTLDYYMDLTRKLVDEDIHILAIKDMAGLLTTQSARLLVGSIREEFPDLTIHVHTHDTGGCGVSSMVAAAEAGADIVDGAMDTMSGLTSQPSLGAIVASLRNSEFDTELPLNKLALFNDYWEQVTHQTNCSCGLGQSMCPLRTTLHVFTGERLLRAV
eukprot:GHVS01001849.1.p1 GENE.GHVS01001849.1~~GHVS01001849.1.p1  ORF type:complete len:985 (+),score=127.07 GHVS01001849.1:929-3883(+)